MGTDGHAAGWQAHSVRGRAGGDAGRRSRHLSVCHLQQHRRGDRRRRCGCRTGAVGFVLGIAKAYTTRVGAGPFPTELFDTTGRLLGDRGREFGAVTGRRRRCGWFDATMVRQAVKIGGINGIALTKFDILDGLPELKICTGYRINGVPFRHLPAAPGAQAAAEPEYEMARAGRAPARRAIVGRSARSGNQVRASHRRTRRSADNVGQHQSRNGTTRS